MDCRYLRQTRTLHCFVNSEWHCGCCSFQSLHQLAKLTSNGIWYYGAPRRHASPSHSSRLQAYPFGRLWHDPPSLVFVAQRHDTSCHHRPRYPLAHPILPSAQSQDSCCLTRLNQSPYHFCLPRPRQRVWAKYVGNGELYQTWLTSCWLLDSK